MRKCLSTHNNLSVHNKSYVSLKPVNLKHFYIKPYLAHESEIMFAEAEMEKLRQMGILRRGSSEFLSHIMLIKKSHSGAKLNKAPEYCPVVDFKFAPAGNAHQILKNIVQSPVLYLPACTGHFYLEYDSIFGRDFRFFFRFSTYLWQTNVCICLSFTIFI